MFWRVWETEVLKGRRSPVWLAFLVLPVIPAVLGTMNYMANREILQSQWYSLWTQHTLFNCYFFLPVLVGIFCAWLWRLEWQQQNWNQLMMAVPVLYIYGVKLLMVSCLLLLTQGWTGILFFLAGRFCGLTAAFPLWQVLNWLLCGWLGGMVICALQLLLSLIINNFAIPTGIALLGGVTGLAMTARGWGVFFPYSLLAVGMRANTASAELVCGTWPFVFFCSSYLLLFILAGIWYIGHAELNR